MPTYVYKFVDTGETIEVQQAFTDDTLNEYTHPDSGELLPVKKVFQPVGVTFKGSGFFKTDNRGSKSKSPSSDSGSNGSKSDSGGSGSDSHSTKSSDSGSKSDSSSSGSSKASASSGSD
ncbi:FmdB family zinc ribbon protein [Ilumatobacter nonamiensis]|uniref:FmdB family zinc ribbon protein n=1 Tax=Ilumatobacter nonamiensis TaxID=467093 RepID=UPI000349F246|nr:FmdB family transcriptional regulator [Ilumatobacter nonamiensis]